MYYIHLFINTILIVRICSNNLESLESGTKLASRPTTTKCGASRVILIDLSGDKVTGNLPVVSQPVLFLCLFWRQLSYRMVANMVVLPIQCILLWRNHVANF